MEFEKIFTSFISNPNGFVRQLHMKDAILLSVLEALDAKSVLSSTKPDDIKKSCDMLQSQIQQYQTQIRDNQQLRSQITTLTRENSELRSKINTVTTQVHGANKENSALRSQITTLTTQLQAQIKENSELRSQITTPTTAVCTDEIKTIEQLNKVISNINKRIEGSMTCKVKIDDQNSENAQLRAANKRLEETIANIDKRIETSLSCKVQVPPVVEDNILRGILDDIQSRESLFTRLGFKT